MAADTRTLPSPREPRVSDRAGATVPPSRQQPAPPIDSSLALRAMAAPPAAAASGTHSGRRGRCRTASLAVSLLLHAGVTVVLGVVTLASKEVTQPLLVLASRAPQERVDEPVRMQFQTPRMAPASTAPQQQMSPSLSRAAGPREVALAKFLDETFSLDGIFDASPADSEQIGDAGGENGGEGTGRRTSGADYFGIEAEGKRFVYVVDASTSMVGTRWQTARRELLKSVRSLPSDAQFYIIFFSDQTHLMFGDSLEEVEFRRAGETSVKSVQNWVNSLRFGPSTLPLNSLRIALSLQPDAIFLLTDGEFRDATAHYIATSSGAGEAAFPPIHTIALFSRRGTSTLQQIASETGGKSVYVSGNSG